MLDATPRLTLGRMQNPVRGILHGAAAVASLWGGYVLWERGSGDLHRQLALLVFAASLLALYTASSLYHAVPWRPEWKERMQRLDHSMIYVLVAGTYTPIAFVVLQGRHRLLGLGLAWGIALVGIAQKVLVPAVGDWFSISLQTAQGWIGLPLLLSFAHRMPGPALMLTVLGGVLYTVGMVAFVTQRPRLWPHIFSYHELFHVFVVSGSALHYAVILRYVAPFTGV